MIWGPGMENVKLPANETVCACVRTHTHMEGTVDPGSSPFHADIFMESDV